MLPPLLQLGVPQPGVLQVTSLRKKAKVLNLVKRFVKPEEPKILDTFHLEEEEVVVEGRMRNWRVGRMRKN